MTVEFLSICQLTFLPDGCHSDNILDRELESKQMKKRYNSEDGDYHRIEVYHVTFTIIIYSL